MPAEKSRHRRRLRLAVVGALVILGAAGLPAAWAANPQSPGTLLGYGFDACQAPSSSTMDAWMADPDNPYRGVGIYISGGLRGCSQPNLNAAWVNHQQAAGWHLLPIDVGPQASCSGFSQRVNSDPTNTYKAARDQGTAEAQNAAAVAQSMAIAPNSVLYYDMEAWSTGYQDCDASALWFMSAWTNELHALGYNSGIYSSGASGITLLNQTADHTPTGFALPDHLWFASYYNPCDPGATTNTVYLDAGNWSNHQRVHQYCGGHNATNGGITLNIDSNWMDVAAMSSTTAPIADPNGQYPPGATPPPPAPAAPPITVPSPVPTPVATPSPVAPPTPVVTPSPVAPPTPVVTPSPAVTPSPVAPPTPTATPSPVVTPSPVAPPVQAPAAPPPPAPPAPAPAPVADQPHSMGIVAPVKAAAPALPVAQQQGPKLTPTSAPLPKPKPVPVVAAPQQPADRTETLQAVAAPQPAVSAPHPTMPNDPAIPATPSGSIAQPDLSDQPTIVEKAWHATQKAASWLGRKLEDLFS